MGSIAVNIIAMDFETNVPYNINKYYEDIS